MEPEDLRVDIYLVTHDHQDHLDPETISRYHYRETTRFVAPRFAARRLVSLGVPSKNVVRLDAGEEWSYPGVTVRGVFALPTSADVLDTTGYLLTFDNGRTVYHTSDTGFTAVLLKAVPKAVDVLMVPINGKWGNLTIEQALELTVVVKPRYVMPNHCDLMALNAENPETFRWFCAERRLDVECVTPNFKKPFLWS
jgi:L-ascorbate 6-phosphate lactonase